MSVSASVLLAFVGEEQNGGSPKLRNELAGSRCGRVILHALCVIHHPNRLQWHWRGIVREFGVSPQTATAV